MRRVSLHRSTWLVAGVLSAACASPRVAPQEAMPQVTRTLTPAAPVAFALDAPHAAAPPAGVRSIGRCDARAGTARFTLAHVNDLQARYSDQLGGRSRYGFIAGYLRALKDEVPATLVLDAGDDYEKGSIADLRSLGEGTRQMLQALPIDVRTIGNHDFAYGEAAVLRDVRESAHPVIATNVQYNRDPSLFAPYARFDVGCVKVGVVGVVTSGYGSDDRPSRAPFDGVFVQNDGYTSALDAQVQKHRAEVDVMIALDHIGLWEDLALASRVPGIDVVIGGHSEDLVRTPPVVSRKDGSRAWVMQAGRWGEHVGRADFAVHFAPFALTLEKYRMINVDATLPYANDVGDLASRVEGESAPDAQRVIASLRADVPSSRAMADLVFRAVSEKWQADALVLGRDVFWDRLRRGPLTLQRLYDSVLVQREPSGTNGFASLYVATLTGAELRALREKVKSPAYAVYAPQKLDPERQYQVVLEKRALENPKLAFASGSIPAAASSARFAGEMIDVLEAYARARTAQGLTLD